MDDLLHRLRHDMVELSSQGDNFTQQIWLMYGQFEQVVDRLNPAAAQAALAAIFPHQIEFQQQHSSPRVRRPIRRRQLRDKKQQQQIQQQKSQNKMAQQLTHHRVVLPEPLRADRYECNSDSESDSEPEVPAMVRGLYGSRAGQRPGLNPLLETISVIGDLCDSDDAVDGPTAGLYAGSNSVDSGYKSSCPTPDLAQDASNYISGRPPVLKSRRTLPAVPGSTTTTGNDQKLSASSVAQAPSLPPAPLDLDHLSSLRRTLLTAIERYDTRTKELDRDLMMTVTDRRPRSISPDAKGGRSRSCVTNRSCRVSSIKEPIAATLTKSADAILAEKATSLLQCASDQGSEEQQDGATRFSKVARCMLEIIEDLQRQQQMQQQQQQPSTSAHLERQQPMNIPVVPPKPSRMSIASSVSSAGSSSSSGPAPATPPRVARRGRRKLPTPQPPAVADNNDFDAAADYHLYEEIIYDLGSSNGGIHGHKSSTATVSMDKPCPPTRPPPLPARPARPAIAQTMAALSTTLTMNNNNSCNNNNNNNKPWLNVIKPLRRDRNNQLIRDWTPMTKLNSDVCSRPNVARSNVYTFGCSQPQPQTITKARTVHHEDEYGFRAVSHMV